MTESFEASRRPMVSVIIPAFNYEQFIEQTLDSVRSQTLRDWQCIIVDDGSTDGTADVVARAASGDSRIQLLRQANQGQATARNTGLAAARGKYVQLLDADDLIESNKFQRQAGFLEQHEDVDIVYGSVRYFPCDCPQERRFSLLDPDVPWMPCVSGAGTKLVGVLLEANMMVINSPLIRRSAFDDVGPFDQTLPRADDWDMWLRFALAGKRFEFRDDPGTLALVRAHSKSLTKRDRRMLMSRVAIHRKVADLTRDGEILARNKDLLDWLVRVCDFAWRLDEVIAPDETFVLIDDERIRPELLGYRAVPFTERDGEYAGPPVNDEHAIRELQRLGATGVAYVAIAWPAMWQLELFPAFREHLYKSYQCVLECEDAILFSMRLQNPAAR